MTARKGTPQSFRLSARSMGQLEELARRWDTSKSAVVETALDRTYRDETRRTTMRVEHRTDLGPQDVSNGDAQLVRCPDCGQMEFWSIEEITDHGKCRASSTPCWCETREDTVSETRPEMNYDQFLAAAREALDAVTEDQPMQVRYDAEGETFYACEPGEPAGGINGLWVMEIDHRIQPADVLNADVYAEIVKLLNSALEDIAAGRDEYKHNEYLECIYRLERDARDAEDDQA